MTNECSFKWIAKYTPAILKGKQKLVETQINQIKCLMNASRKLSFEWTSAAIHCVNTFFSISTPRVKHVHLVQTEAQDRNQSTDNCIAM